MNSYLEVWQAQCSLYELDVMFRTGHRVFYCAEGSKGPASGRRKEALCASVF